MQSRIVNRGNRTVLEIETDSTGFDRQMVADAAWAAHGLRPGSVSVEFLNPSTENDNA
jgi:hypothetical protein